MTLILFSFVFLGTAADAALKQLAADVARAMKRADLTQDYVSRVLGIPPNKLSRQLSGQLPLTTLCRFFTNAEMRQTDFCVEFLDILANQIDRAVLTPDKVRDLVTTAVQEAIGKKPMAKMALATAQKAEKTA